MAMKPQSYSSSPRLKNTVRLQLNALEERAVPASFTVDTISDEPVTGKLTLREAFTKANANNEDDTIILSETLNNQTIKLTGGELKSAEAGKGLSIEYSGPNPGVTIDAQSKSRIFNVAAGAKLTLPTMTLINGKADKGGAIFNAGELFIQRTTIKSNESTSEGGAVFSGLDSILTVSGSTISENSATTNGGAFSAIQAKTFRIFNSLINSNSATLEGGGVYGGNLTVLNSTFSSNSADLNGGGLWFNGQLLCVNSTFYDNAADYDSNNTGIGGSLFAATGSDGRVTNSLMVGNEVGKSPNAKSNEIAGTLSVANSKFNIVGDGVGTGGLVDGVEGNIVGTINALTVLDKTLALNGAFSGEPLTHALIAGSKAINAGSNALAISPVTSSALSSDGRGFPFARIVDTTVDIGAFELVNLTPRVVVPTSAFTILEDDKQGVTFTGTGKTITVTDDAGVSPNYTVTLKASNKAAQSAITLGTTTGLTNVAGNGTGEVSFKAPSLAIVNTALVGLKYVAAPDLNLFSEGGGGGFTITVDDGDTTAPGGAKSGNSPIDVKISSVIDTPSVTSPSTKINTAVDVVLARNAVDGTEITHFKVTNLTGGTLSYVGPLSNDSVAITNGNVQFWAGSLIDLKANPSTTLVFTPTPGFEGFASFDIQAAQGTYSQDPVGGPPNPAPEFGGPIVTSKITVGTPDSVAPVATIVTAANLGDSSKGAKTYDFTVRYTDNLAVLFSSLDGKDVRVTGPNSFNQLASLVSVDKNANGTPLVATYRITAPGGDWDFADNGAYTITLEATQISDTASNLAAAGKLGSFTANLSNPAKPVLVGSQQFAVGSDFGANGSVQFFNADKSSRLIDPLFPFEGFTGAVRVASGDVNGDGVSDIVVGTGAGRATQVKIIDGAKLTELKTIDPFEATFKGGVYVAVGDLNGDGFADIVITPDEGGGPRARVFSGKDFSQLADFFGIEDPNFRGGARAAIGDITGDGKAELVIAAGFGGGPRVSVFDGAKLSAEGGLTENQTFSRWNTWKPFGDFLTFEPGLRNGSFVAVGDVNGDGKADLVAGGGPGGGPRVTIFDGASLFASIQKPIANFFTGDVNSRGGVRVAVKNLDGDTKADVLTGSGTGSGSKVIAYVSTQVLTEQPSSLYEFDAIPGYTGGIFVG
jgi:hypothetical protein